LMRSPAMPARSNTMPSSAGTAQTSRIRRVTSRTSGLPNPRRSRSLVGRWSRPSHARNSMAPLRTKLFLWLDPARR
jgi:hypothetical protein